MRRLSLTEWATVGELVATFAVFASLVFLIFSVDQNTAAIQGSNENLLFERHTELATQFTLDPSLAELLLKMRGEDPELTPVEAIRWEKYQLNLLDIWAFAYNRHQRGLLGDEEWVAWDTYFTELFRAGGERLSHERWSELVYGFAADFWQHVGVALF